MPEGRSLLPFSPSLYERGSISMREKWNISFVRIVPSRNYFIPVFILFFFINMQESLPIRF